MFFGEFVLLYGSTKLYRYHKILVVQQTRAKILQFANFQLLSNGSLRSGLLGNPIGRLHFFHCGLHPIHPWHKCLDWSPPKSMFPIFWVILDLKIKRKKTLVRDKLFWICLAYLQSIQDFLGPIQSSQWSLTFHHHSNCTLQRLFQRIWFHVGMLYSHGFFFLFSWLVLE